MKQYPFISFPIDYRKYEDDYDFFDTPFSPEPNTPKKREASKGFIYVFILSLLFIVVLYLYINLFAVIFYVILILPYPFLWFVNTIKFINETKSINRHDLIQYSEELKETQKKNENILLKREEISKNLNEYIINQKAKVLKNYIEPYCDFNHRNINSTTGASEVFFLDFLYKYFSDILFLQSYVNIPNVAEYQNKDICYFPDFVIKSTNFIFDIEIDEPYTLKSKKPIHYIDNESDIIRDLYFNRYNWCVIRFCEEQIINQPNECCFFIAEQIFLITGISKYLEMFETKKTIIKLNRWTTEQSIKLMDISYRENLLLTLNSKKNESQYCILTCGYDFLNEFFPNHIFLYKNNNDSIKKIVCPKFLLPDIKVDENIQLNLNDYNIVKEEVVFEDRKLKPTYEKLAKEYEYKYGIESSLDIYENDNNYDNLNLKETVYRIIDLKNKITLSKDQETIFNNMFVFLNNIDFDKRDVNYLELVNSDPFFYRNFEFNADYEDIFDANSDLDKLIELDSNCKLFQVLKGIALVRRGIYEEAEKLLQKYIHEPQFTAIISNYLGEYKLKNNDYESAEKYLNQAIEIDNEYGIAYCNLSSLKLKLMEFEKSILYSKKVIEIEPKVFRIFFQAYLNIGDAKKGLYEYVEAIEHYSLAIEIFPQMYEFYVNRGICKFELNDFLGAICDYTEAINVDPSRSARAYCNRGIAKREIKDYTGAMSDYTKSMNISSNYADPYKNRGDLKYFLNDIEGAEKDYRIYKDIIEYKDCI